jgi:hypothetical protein
VQAHGVERKRRSVGEAVVPVAQNAARSAKWIMVGVGDADVARRGQAASGFTAASRRRRGTS